MTKLSCNSSFTCSGMNGRNEWTTYTKLYQKINANINSLLDSNICYY